MKTSSVFWNIQLTRGFKKSYGELSLKDKWIVKHFLSDIRYLKDPRKHYAYETCKDCPHLTILINEDFRNRAKTAAALRLCNSTEIARSQSE